MYGFRRFVAREGLCRSNLSFFFFFVRSDTDFTVRLVGGPSAEHVAVGERLTHDIGVAAEAFCRLVYGRPTTRRARARIP